MRDRAVIPINLARAVLAAVTALATLPAAASAAGAPDITLRLEDLAERLRADSPLARIIDRGEAVVAAGRDAALRPSAPTLGWDLEDAPGGREWQVTLGKRFERPFAQGALRSAWDLEQSAAGLAREQQQRDLLAVARSGYVRLALLERHRRDLDGLSALVRTATDVARERHAEGVLAGTEARLLALSAQAVDALGRRLEAERLTAEAAWRTELGLPAEGNLRLASDVGFAAFTPPEPARLSRLAAEAPGVRALAARAAAAGDHTRAHRPGAVPAFEAYGGFRRFGGDADGLVAGLAVDLPWAGRDAGLARQYAAEQAVLEHEHALAVSRAAGEAAALGAGIAAAAAALAGYAAELEAARDLPRALLVSFREGALPLGALLDAVQVQAAALDSYYAELGSYYDHLFRLEAVTGEAIVRFAAQE